MGEHLSRNGKHARLLVPESYKIMWNVVRFMYFCGLDERELDPVDALDVLQAAATYGVEPLSENDVAEIFLPKLSKANCVGTLLHPEIANYPEMAKGVCEYFGTNLQELLADSGVYTGIFQLNLNYLTYILKRACHLCRLQEEVDSIITFALKYAKLENPCDVLRESKVWPWASLDDKPQDEFIEPVRQSRVSEWSIGRAREALQADSVTSTVCGDCCDWKVRIDNAGGANGGQLRIVYEDVKVRDLPEDACVRRFPAATFAWQVLHNGREIFVEKPVFIAFADKVSLHWSTALTLNFDELAPEDELTLRVKVAENPLISLVLYLFSSEVRNEAYTEDILNRLPHIEYRCLSSYVIFRRGVRRGSPMAASTNGV